MSHRVRVILLTVLLAVLLPLLGCDTAEIQAKARQAIETVEPIKADLEDRRLELRDTIESSPAATPDEIEAWRAELATIELSIAAAEKALDAAHRILDDPTGGPISEAVGVVAPFVPEPYRLPLVLAAGLAASIARGIQLRRAGRAVASGVQKAIGADPELAARFHAQAARVASEQTPLAKRLVDEAQGKKRALPI